MAWRGIGQQVARCLGAAWLVWASALVATAQDITLTARDGSLAVSGRFTSYDGEFFRLTTEFGPLTVTAASVICDGPACPDLTAPKAVIRLTGDAATGAALLPPLIAAFARQRGFSLRQSDTATLLTQPDTGDVLGEFTFTPRAPESARSAMADGNADLVVARFVPLDADVTLLAQDALVAIVAAGNPMPHLSTADLAAVLERRVTNWQQLGGPDWPIVLHGLAADSDVTAALTARLGSAPRTAKTHPDMAALAVAVARDPWALAMTGMAQAAPARVLPLQDSCGFALDPSAMSVATEDYPLALPAYLLTPPRRLPLLAREFLEFMALPAAQSAIVEAGFVGRGALTAQPLVRDGARLINAVKAAKDSAGLDLLQRLTFAMQTHDRLPISFRFEEGSDTLDPRSTAALADLAQHLAAGTWAGRTLVLVGFAQDEDDGGLGAGTLLAERVLDQLMQTVPDLPASAWPRIESFGNAMPLACDTTPAGQKLNHRVELWVQAK